MKWPHPSTWLDPVTRKRLQRFRQLKRSWWAFWILLGLYAASLGSELICNDKPLAVRFEGRWCFPVFHFYPEDTFLKNGRMTRPDYKTLAADPSFSGTPDNVMIFTPIPFGPLEINRPDRIQIPNEVIAVFVPEPRVGTVDVGTDGLIRRPVSVEWVADEWGELEGRFLEETVKVSDAFRAAMARRFENQ